MATFEAQVEGLTGLSIDGSSSPTQTELSQFLKDGVVDVINKLIKTDKSAATTLGIVTSESGSGTIIDGVILDVWGSDGTNDHPATAVPASIGKRAVDTDSLAYRSKYNPCYYREGKRVIVKPNGGSILHITYPSVAYDQETIYNVPNQYISLIMIYAGIKALGNALSAKTFPSDVSLPVLPSLPTLTATPTSNAVPPTLAIISTSLPTFSEPSAVVMPAALADVNISFDLPEFPTFIQPSVPTLSSSLPEFPTFIKPAVPTLSSSSVTLPGNIPLMGSVESAAAYSTIDTYIDTEEDVELAATKIKEMGLKLKEYETDIQKNLNAFNANNVQYQASVQKALQDAQLESQDDVQKVQKFQAEVQAESARTQSDAQEYQQKLATEIQTFQANIQKYSAEVQSQQQKTAIDVQEYQQKLGKDLQTYQAETGYDVAKLTAEVQKEVHRFTQDLAKENAVFQAALGKYQAEVSKISADNQSSIQKYSADIQKYSSDVQGVSTENQTLIGKYNAEVQPIIGKFSAEIQKYSAEIQKAQADYQWMQGRQQGLLQEYYSAFAQGQPAPNKKIKENQRERRR